MTFGFSFLGLLCLICLAVVLFSPKLVIVAFLFSVSEIMKWLYATFEYTWSAGTYHHWGVYCWYISITSCTSCTGPILATYAASPVNKKTLYLTCYPWSPLNLIQTHPGHWLRDLLPDLFPLATNDDIILALEETKLLPIVYFSPLFSTIPLSLLTTVCFMSAFQSKMMEIFACLHYFGSASTHTR